MTTHHLKCHAPCFDAIKVGVKKFDIRRDDRFYQPGDTIVLTRIPMRTDPFHKLPDIQVGGRNAVSTHPETLERRVGWLLRGGQYGLDSKYVAFTLEDPQAGVTEEIARPAKAPKPKPDAIEADFCSICNPVISAALSEAGVARNVLPDAVIAIRKLMTIECGEALDAVMRKVDTRAREHAGISAVSIEWLRKVVRAVQGEGANGESQ